MGSKSFKQELEKLINKHSRENESDTPDYILANFMMASLEAFETATRFRSGWHQKGVILGKRSRPGACRG